jgi:hypothetical protein
MAYISDFWNSCRGDATSTLPVRRRTRVPGIGVHGMLLTWGSKRSIPGVLVCHACELPLFQAYHSQQDRIRDHTHTHGRERTVSHLGTESLLKHTAARSVPGVHSNATVLFQVQRYIYRCESLSKSWIKNIDKMRNMTVR